MRVRRAISALVAIAIVAGAIYVILEPVAVFGYDGAALGESLEGEAPDTYGNASCTEQGRAWVCQVEVDPGSTATVGYALTVDDDGCWNARGIPSGSEPAPSEPESGCVDILDIVGFSSLFDQSD